MRISDWSSYVCSSDLLVAFFAGGGHRYVGFDTLERHHEALMALVAAHRLAAPLTFVALYAVMVAFSIPGALVMTVAAGFLFGTLLGAACSVADRTSTRLNSSH